MQPFVRGSSDGGPIEAISAAPKGCCRYVMTFRRIVIVPAHSNKDPWFLKTREVACRTVLVWNSCSLHDMLSNKQSLLHLACSAAAGAAKASGPYSGGGGGGGGTLPGVGGRPPRGHSLPDDPSTSGWQNATCLRVTLTTIKPCSRTMVPACLHPAHKAQLS